MLLNDRGLQSRLEEIASVEQAEAVALEIVRRLNAVVKLREVEDRFAAEVYELKRQLIHYCDARGYVCEKQRDDKNIQVVTIRAHGQEFMLHHKALPKVGRERRRNVMQKDEDELPRNVRAWSEDREAMLGALRLIALKLGVSKPFV